MQGNVEREHSNVWDSLVSGAADLHADELRAEVIQAFLDDLVDPFFVTPEEAARDIAPREPRVLEDLRYQRYVLIEDAIHTMEHWHCFSGPPREGPHAEDDGGYEDGDATPRGLRDPEVSFSPPEAIQAEDPPGRNDPCPCGSGKKYKKCCARRPKEPAEE
jgi:hypothetical protein